jgi:two-component system, cell cycle response regulator
MYDAEMQEVFDKLKIFEKMYEDIRFVDPVFKKIVNYKNNSVSELDVRCFDFWGKNKICDNCVSVRAFNENETFVKVEYSKDKIYMITAIPFELSHRRIVIELMKDITKSMIFGTAEESNDNKSEIYAMIESMNNLALKDALTGVYNRRYINEKLPIDIISAALAQQNMSIIIADIDYFKNANDTYGHLAGDCVLKNFAETLTQCIQRESDWVARFGGEEFLICLPGANLEKAVEIAKLMRKNVEEKETLYGENTLRITASFGVCSVNTKQGDSVDTLIQSADSKLYLAKNSGRNRVEF